jgi:hypothetical protein
MTRTLTINQPSGISAITTGITGEGIFVTGTAIPGNDFDEPVCVIALVPDHFGNAETHAYDVTPQTDKTKTDWSCFFHPPQPGHWYGLVGVRAVNDTPPPRVVTASTDYHFEWNNDDDPTGTPLHIAGVSVEITSPAALTGAGPDEKVPFNSSTATVTGTCSVDATLGGLGDYTRIIPCLFWFDKFGNRHRRPLSSPEGIMPTPDPHDLTKGTWSCPLTLPVQEAPRDPVNTVFCATLKFMDSVRSRSDVRRLQFSSHLSPADRKAKLTRKSTSVKRKASR